MIVTVVLLSGMVIGNVLTLGLWQDYSRFVQDCSRLWFLGWFREFFENFHGILQDLGWFREFFGNSYGILQVYCRYRGFLVCSPYYGEILFPSVGFSTRLYFFHPDFTISSLVSHVWWLLCYVMMSVTIYWWWSHIEHIYYMSLYYVSHMINK